MKASISKTSLLHLRTFPKGAVIIKEGEIGKCAYIIQSGRVEVSINASNKPVKVSVHGEGELIGEMAMIDDLPRTATIKAISDCELIEISRSAFSERLKISDPVLSTIMRLILKRYRGLLETTKGSSISSKNNTIKQQVEKNLQIDDKNNIDVLEVFKKTFEIQEGFKNNEFIFHYQPIVSSVSGKIAGFEALVRWEHPEKGLVYPDEFIPLCEKNGLIYEITSRAIINACSDLKKFKSNASHSATEDNLFVSINLSVSDIENPGLLALLQEENGENKTCSSLHVEIVESLFIEKPDKAREFFKQCSEMGISVSLDDFGTGFSSLSYLQEYEFDTLKIDRKFVSSMLTEKKSLVLVKMIISLANDLGVHIIAEGVENKEEMELLKKMGVDYIQGYYYSKPVPFSKACDYVVNGIK